MAGTCILSFKSEYAKPGSPNPALCAAALEKRGLRAKLHIALIVIGLEGFTYMVFDVPVVYPTQIIQPVSLSHSAQWQVFGAKTGIRVSQAAAPSVTLASPTLSTSLVKRNIAISGVTVSDTTGNPITVTFSVVPNIIVAPNVPPVWTPSGDRTNSNLHQWSYTGTLAQVNTALTNIILMAPVGTYVFTFTATNGQASSAPVSLTLKVN